MPVSFGRLFSRFYVSRRIQAQDKITVLSICCFLQFSRPDDASAGRDGFGSALCYQSSVRNGEASTPFLPQRLAPSGLFAHA